MKPADAAVRTDMGTAFWFMGNADRAIVEFDKALTYVPNNPNTLFNLGLVKWKGKTDAAGAIAAWEKLLATAPNYEQKTQVEQMLGEARNHVAGGSAAKPNSARGAKLAQSYRSIRRADETCYFESVVCSGGTAAAMLDCPFAHDQASTHQKCSSNRSVLHRGAITLEILVRSSSLLNRIV